MYENVRGYVLLIHFSCFKDAGLLAARGLFSYQLSQFYEQLWNESKINQFLDFILLVHGFVYGEDKNLRNLDFVFLKVLSFEFLDFLLFKC